MFANRQPGEDSGTPERMMKRKRSDSASASPRRPAPESNDVKQSEAWEESPLGTPDAPPAAEPSTAVRLLLKDNADADEFLKEAEEYFKDVDPEKYLAFERLVVAQAQAVVGFSCCISQVKEIFRGHTDMLKLYNEILPPNYKILLKENVPEIQDLAKLYVDKVKKRRSPSEYTTFMHILYLYNERALPSDEVDREVEMLFVDCCDLLEEFDCLRPNRTAPVVQSRLHPRHSDLEVREFPIEQQSERLQRMCEDVAKRKRKEKGKGVVTELKQLPPPPPKRVSSPRPANASNALGNRRSSRAEARHPRRPTHTTPATVTKGRSASRSRRKPKPDEEYIGRAMCTPSYLLVKNGDGESEVSVHRSELAKSVLNEECVLVRPTASGHRTYNPYEEALFECGTNHYDSDMILIKYEATIENCLNYLLKFQDPNGGELPPIREFLSPIHIGCIQTMYGDKIAPKIMKALEKNLVGGLHVILNRLILQLESMTSLKAEIIPQWVQVYKNNFHLALSHSSVDCKSKMKLTNINNLEA